MMRAESDRANDVSQSKILLVDDDVELLDMLRTYLARDGFDVIVESDAEAGVAAALAGDFQLVVLDVMMPRLTGIEALTRIRRVSRVPVLMLTAKGDEADRIVGLELGADDYVPKPCAPRELAARVRAILRRTQSVETPDGAAPIEAGPLKLFPQQRRAEWDGRPLDLTSTEFNLLEALARNAGRPVTKEALSEHALGRPLTRFDRSIDVHGEQHTAKARHASRRPLVDPDGRAPGLSTRAGVSLGASLLEVLPDPRARASDDHRRRVIGDLVAAPGARGGSAGNPTAPAWRSRRARPAAPSGGAAAF
jgi:DNA-binding response OmpR family regulator